MSYSGFSGYHSHSQLALLTPNSTTAAPNVSTLDTHLTLSNSPNVAIMNGSVNENQSVSTNVSLSPSSSSSVCALPSAYDSRIISSYQRLPGLYSSSYHDQNSLYPSHTANPFYSSFGHPYEVKDPNGGWSALPQTMCYPYEASLYNPYGDRYSAMDSAARRKNATRETTNTLKAWLYEHRKNPYPTKGEKIMLAIITKMTLTQVSTWFANARRRLKKENKMTWEPRNKCNDKEDDDINSSDDETENKPTTIRESEQTSNICHMNATDKDLQTLTPTTPTSHRTDRNESFKDSASYEIKESIADNSHSVHHHSHNGRDSRDAKPLLSHQINNNSRTQLASIQHIKRESSATMLDNVNNLDSIGQRPKIWSLAQTATSESPPYAGKLSSVSCNEWTPTLPLGADSALPLSDYQRECPQPSHLTTNSLRKAGIGWPEENCVTNCGSPRSSAMQLFTHESIGHTSYLHSHSAKQSSSASFTANSHHHHSHHSHHTFSPSISHLVHGNHESFSPYNNVSANSIRPIIDSQQSNNFSYINENRVSNGLTNGSISKSNTFLCKVFPEYISSGPDALSLADNNSERGGGSTMSIEDSSMSSSSSPNLDTHASISAKQTKEPNSGSFSAFRPMLKR